MWVVDYCSIKYENEHNKSQYDYINWDISIAKRSTKIWVDGAKKYCIKFHPYPESLEESLHE